MLLNLDTSIIWKLNAVAVSFPSLSRFVHFIGENELFQGGVVFVAAVWWLWFEDETSPEEGKRSNRQIVIGILVGCLLGVLATRVLTHVLPFRTRPIFATELHLTSLFQPPAGLDHRTSFPSDHATLAFSLATGFFFRSRWIGTWALLYAVLVTCFPRVFLGYHYPSDILVGGLVGVGAACLANLPIVRRTFYRPVLAWQVQYPALFYMCLFLLTYQIATLFGDLRVLLGSLLHLG